MKVGTEGASQKTTVESEFLLQKTPRRVFICTETGCINTHMHCLYLHSATKPDKPHKALASQLAALPSLIEKARGR
jgi:hypothetical protein